MRDENEIFAEWRVAQGATKQVLETELIRALRAHAYAVSWLTLRESDPDVVNWAVFMAIRHAPKFKGEAKFSSWFHQICKNFCLTTLAKRKRRKEVGLEDLTQAELETIAGGQDDTDLELDGLVTQLSEPEQELVRLKLSGLSSQAIAETLGVAPSTVSERWTQLQRRLQQYAIQT